jgi:hypothetical protein
VNDSELSNVADRLFKAFVDKDGKTLRELCDPEARFWSSAVGSELSLDELIATGRGSWRDPPADLEVAVEPGRTADRVAELIAAHGPLAVVAPGLVERPSGPHLLLRLGTSR